MIFRRAKALTLRAILEIKVNFTKEEITLVFKVWARNYAENSEMFDVDALDLDPQDYGERAAELFLKIYDELFET